MQLIWVAGPTARVVTLSITARNVLMAVATVSCFLVILGVIFNFIGLRVAIEYVPELAQRIGGVTSQSEQMKAEALYRAKLTTLNEHLDSVSGRLKELESIKNEVLGRMGVEKLLPVSGVSRIDATLGRGGPLNLLPLWGLQSNKLSHQIEESLTKVMHYDKTLEKMQAQWEKDRVRLERVPTMLPLTGDFLLTSSFGVRADPLTHLPSMHEGIDFVAPVGTLVRVTAPGEVLKAEFSGAYGNLVEVRHGFVTRYAHLKTIFVRPGQSLDLLDPVGNLGNTGRSTGPHLHYEVIFRGQAMHPAKALAMWSRP